MKCWFITYRSKTYGGHGKTSLSTSDWEVFNDVTSLHPVIWLLRLKKEEAVEQEEWRGPDAKRDKWYGWSEYALLFYEEIPMNVYTKASEVLG